MCEHSLWKQLNSVVRLPGEEPVVVVHTLLLAALSAPPAPPQLLVSAPWAPSGSWTPLLFARKRRPLFPVLVPVRTEFAGVKSSLSWMLFSFLIPPPHSKCFTFFFLPFLKCAGCLSCPGLRRPLWQSASVRQLISGWGQSRRWPPRAGCRTLESRRCWWTCRWRGPAPAAWAATPDAARRSGPPPRAAASSEDTSVGGKGTVSSQSQYEQEEALQLIKPLSYGLYLQSLIGI